MNAPTLGSLYMSQNHQNLTLTNCTVNIDNRIVKIQLTTGLGNNPGEPAHLGECQCVGSLFFRFFRLLGPACCELPPTGGTSGGHLLAFNHLDLSVESAWSVLSPSLLFGLFNFNFFKFQHLQL